jgi:hypothetical protein
MSLAINALMIQKISTRLREKIILYLFLLNLYLFKDINRLRMFDEKVILPEQLPVKEK